MVLLEYNLQQSRIFILLSTNKEFKNMKSSQNFFLKSIQSELHQSFEIFHSYSFTFPFLHCTTAYPILSHQKTLYYNLAPRGVYSNICGPMNKLLKTNYCWQRGSFYFCLATKYPVTYFFLIRTRMDSRDYQSLLTFFFSLTQWKFSNNGLYTWLSCQEHWMLFQRT